MKLPGVTICISMFCSMVHKSFAVLVEAQFNMSLLLHCYTSVLMVIPSGQLASSGPGCEHQYWPVKIVHRCTGIEQHSSEAALHTGHGILVTFAVQMCSCVAMYANGQQQMYATATQISCTDRLKARTLLFRVCFEMGRCCISQQGLRQHQLHSSL